MLRITDFLIACEIPLNLNSYKIHLATGSTSPPLDAFFEGKFKEWQEGQTRRNFPCDMVIALIELRKNEWLFAGVYKILEYEEKSEKNIEYSTELLGGQDELIGRVVVHHERKGQASYLKGQPDREDFYISEIMPKKLSVKEFPGYNSVCVPFRELQIIINQNIQSWYGALSNIKGVYLITDNQTGKLYVGKATGNSGIWQRWADYVNNGHGGNEDLRALLESKGVEYRLNFQYAILEIADSHASDDYILQREAYWKNILKTREFGYIRVLHKS